MQVTTTYDIKAYANVAKYGTINIQILQLHYIAGYKIIDRSHVK